MANPCSETLRISVTALGRRESVVGDCFDEKQPVSAGDDVRSCKVGNAPVE